MSNFEMVMILHSYNNCFSRKGLLTMMFAVIFSMMTMMDIKIVIMIIPLTMVTTIITNIKKIKNN